MIRPTAPNTWMSKHIKIAASSQHKGMFLLTDTITNKWWGLESTAEQMLRNYPINKEKKNGKKERIRK